MGSGPTFFPIIIFESTTLVTGMTGISLHMQLRSRMAVSLKENNWFFITNQTPHPYLTSPRPVQFNTKLLCVTKNLLASRDSNPNQLPRAVSTEI
jgi:hypothetical protein